jgi:putative ABC transport system permease protein
VGTDASFLSLYGARVAQGRAFSEPMDALLGATVAQRSGLAPGTQLVGTHGLASSGSAHEEHPYRVVGVLAPTGTVVDRLVLTPLASVWEVHDEHRGEGPAHDGKGEPKREITALLGEYAPRLPRRSCCAAGEFDHV